MTVCSTCQALFDDFLAHFFNGQTMCPRCAHNLSHAYPLRAYELACPVVDGVTHQVIPYGTYPNIDYS